MIQEADLLFPLETGGVLMGYWLRSGKEVIIKHAIGPGPKALHYAKSFIPDDEYQQAAIARIYEESERMHIYLGDWHTHPKASTSLSYKDRRTLRKIAAWEDAGITLPIMAVLADGDPDWHISIWRFDPLHLGRLIIRNNVAPAEISFYKE